MISHETECIYRLVRCPDIECASELAFAKLLEHVEEEENIVKIKPSETKQIRVKSDFFGRVVVCRLASNFLFHLLHF